MIVITFCHKFSISFLKNFRRLDVLKTRFNKNCLFHYSTKKTYELSHVSEKDGKAKMIDVSSKLSTPRTAIASAKVVMSPYCFDKIEQNSSLKKGDIFPVATVAGIQAAKRTSELIPLCHQINLSKIDLTFLSNKIENTILVKCTCSCTEKTGVEMEALTGATVAALAIYDMGKAVDPNMRITDIKLESKTK